MQNAANRIASRENENNTKRKLFNIIIQYAKANGKLFTMNHLMGNRNHTLIIINAGNGHTKFNSDKSKRRNGKQAKIGDE